MGDAKFSLINTDGLGEFGKAVVNAVQSAVGKIYEPQHLKRMARASNEASAISAQGEMELVRIQERLLNKEIRRQRNIDSIVAVAVQQEGQVSQEKVDEDWMARFMECAQDVSKEDMQHWWGKILAGEVSSPGAYSLRTLDALRHVTIEDAEYFSRLCRRAWSCGPERLVFKGAATDERLKSDKVYPIDLMNLESLGLIDRNSLVVRASEASGELPIGYMGEEVVLVTSPPLETILFTAAGRELATLVTIEPDLAYRDALLAEWRVQGVTMRDKD